MRCRLIIVLLCLAAVGQGIPIGDSTEVKSDITINDVPYVAQIRGNHGTFHCCGAILNSLYILAPASCVYEAAPSDLVVAVGSSTLDGGTEYSIRSISINEEYDALDDISPNDIAMLKLEKYLRYSAGVRPIALPELYQNERLEEGSIVNVTGWGGSSTVRKISQVVVGLRECREAYSHFLGVDITNEFICSETADTENDGHGDHGSPLVNDKMLVGLKLKAAEGKPDVYTRIRTHLEWIEENNTDY